MYTYIFYYHYSKIQLGFYPVEDKCLVKSYTMSSYTTNKIKKYSMYSSLVSYFGF